MLYATHKAGGAFGMLLAFQYMKSKGLLVDDLAPLMQLAIMYPTASFGSTLPDLDHHWGSVKEKTPFNFAVHKVLHLTNPKHRSWQTHSVLVTGGFCYLLWALVNLCSVIYGNTITVILLRLMVVGLAVGITSHLVLDVLTTAGIHIIPGKKFRLVPKSSAFATGTPWESFVMKLLCLGITLLVGYELYEVIINIL